VALLQLFPEIGDVVGHGRFISLCKEMKQGDPGLETSGKFADKQQTTLPVTNGLRKRHQDMPGVRPGQGYDPHDGQISLDCPQKEMNQMPLSVGSIAAIGRQGIKKQIGLFRLYTPGQQYVDLSDLGYAGHRDTQLRGNRVQMILMADRALKCTLVSALVMRGIQYKLGFACNRYRESVTG
jgi:hypothetical protein